MLTGVSSRHDRRVHVVNKTEHEEEKEGEKLVTIERSMFFTK